MNKQARSNGRTHLDVLVKSCLENASDAEWIADRDCNGAYVYLSAHPSFPKYTPMHLQDISPSLIHVTNDFLYVLTDLSPLDSFKLKTSVSTEDCCISYSWNNYEGNHERLFFELTPLETRVEIRAFQPIIFGYSTREILAAYVRSVKKK